MRAREAALLRVKKVARVNLDEEMLPFRRAGMDKNYTRGLLRAVRKVLGVPVKEIAEKLGMERSGIYEIEERELKGKVGLLTMDRLAGAMDCKVVYGIVPNDGWTLDELYQKRLWARVLGTGIRDQ